jgi:hypothetical protein
MSVGDYECSRKYGDTVSVELEGIWKERSRLLSDPSTCLKGLKKLTKGYPPSGSGF